MRALYLFVVSLALLVALPSHAQLTIEITRGRDSPTVIAVAPIGANRNLPEDISAIVDANLERSGYFKPIKRQSMLSFPTRANEVHYRDWRILDTEYVVVGDLQPLDGGRVRVEFSLLQVNNERRILSHTIEGSTNELRDIAHYISDKVYEAITGIRGAFGTRVAYIAAQSLGNGRHQYRLMVADADGARERMLLESRQPIMSPSWSPDGRQLAYVSFETGRPAIFRQVLATGEREQLTEFRGLNGAPSWSPDGKKLAFVLSKDGNPEVYPMEMANRRLTRVTNHFAIDTEPSWTPDGRALVFTSDRGGAPQIYKVTLSNQQVERLTFEGNYNARPSLSADGRTLVMVHRGRSGFTIASQDLQTGNVRVLTDSALDESPTVAPNGAMLMYATKRGERSILAAVSLDAGVRYLLPARQGDVREPSWSPFLN